MCGRGSTQLVRKRYFRVAVRASCLRRSGVLLRPVYSLSSKSTSLPLSLDTNFPKLMESGTDSGMVPSSCRGSSHYGTFTSAKPPTATFLQAASILHHYH